MTRFTVHGLVLLALCAGCGHGPQGAQVPAPAGLATAARCQQAFPRQPWRATHTLVARHPAGLASGVLGAIAAGGSGLHVVLLSPEGIRLFDAWQRHAGSGGITLLRALPPLDHSLVAPTLLADLGAALLSPAGPPTIGQNAAGATLCRWSAGGHDATEVELGASGPTRIRTYRQAQVTRDIELLGAASDGFVTRRRLQAMPAGYSLDITMVSHE